MDPQQQPSMSPQQQIPSQQLPVQTVTVQQNDSGEAGSQSKSHKGAWIIFFLFLLLLIGTGVYAALHYNVLLLLQKTTSSPSEYSSSGIQQAKTVDLSPNVPSSQKTAVLIQLSDSSFEKVIMAKTLVPAYIKSLPEGEKVISQTPVTP